jgi:hypothetical protein
VLEGLGLGFCGRHVEGSKLSFELVWSTPNFVYIHGVGAVLKGRYVLTRDSHVMLWNNPKCIVIDNQGKRRLGR